MIKTFFNHCAKKLWHVHKTENCITVVFNQEWLCHQQTFVYSISSCENWWVDIKDDRKHPTMHRRALTMNYLCLPKCQQHWEILSWSHENVWTRPHRLYREIIMLKECQTRKSIHVWFPLYESHSQVRLILVLEVRTAGSWWGLQESKQCSISWAGY